MISEEIRHGIHFQDLSQNQLNELLKVSNQFNISLCYLGHQEVHENDLIIVSSHIKSSELKKIREKYHNWVFVLIEQRLSAKTLNEFNEIGRIHYLDHFNLEEIFLHLRATSPGKAPQVQARDDTLAIISHDLKNPLNAIRLDAQILLRHARKESEMITKDEIIRFVSRIIKTTDRLSLLVSDLLEHDKSGNALNSLTRTPVDLKKMVDEVIEVVFPLAKRNSIKIKRHFQEKIPLFHADKNKLFQVLLNLLGNALKFSPQHTSVQVRLFVLDQKIHFSVEDSGPGVDPEIEKNLYQRYQAGSKRHCGTGLGLYICRTIIEAHQGTIGHRRGEKGGAIFEFELPLEMSPHKDLKSKVYLIDDDEDLRDVLSWALNSEGLHVESFSHPDNAFTFLRERRERPSLIVSQFNLNIPVEEFLRARKELHDVPFILMSTSPQVVREHMTPSEFTEILAKPLRLEAFVERVTYHLNTTGIQPE